MRITPYLLRLWRHSLVLYLIGSLVSTVQWGMSILVIGVIVRAIFDAITDGASVGTDVYTLCGIFMVLNVVHNMLVNPSGRISEEFLTSVLQGRLQRNLFKTMLEHRPVESGPSSGEMVNRYRDDVEATVEPLFLVAEMTGMVVALGAAVYIMASIDPLITLAAFLPATIILTGTKLLGNRIESLRRTSREATSRVSGLLGELLGGVQVLQVAGAEERAAKHFELLGEDRRKADLKEGLLDALIQSLNGSVVTVSTGVILLAAAQLMRAGSFTVGDFALFVFVAGGPNTGYALRWIGEFLASQRRARVSFLRLTELIPDAPPESLVQGESLHLWGPIPEEPYPAKTRADALSTLEVRGITYEHRETGRGVRDVSLELPRGSFTVVTGRIGSGKTTLLEVLLGLLPLDRGEVLWNGRHVESLRTFLAPPRCAYTPQAPWLYSDSVRNNILLGLGAGEQELCAAVRLGVLERDVAELEHGLDTVVGPRGVRLSGGQAQRTAAARMFVRDSELLVFDDLSSALDVATERTLWERLFELEGVTSLVVSHRRTALVWADHIVVLKDGRVESEGKLGTLLDSSAEMRRLWAGDVGVEPESDGYTKLRGQAP